MKYIIGDTIRLKATIKNLLGVEDAPASISVKIYTLNGTEIYEDTTPTLSAGTTAQYYSDYEIPASLATEQQLTVIWEWSGPHKKRMYFIIIP